MALDPICASTKVPKNLDFSKKLLSSGPIAVSFRAGSGHALKPLKENMVISNEPGYYESGQFGIRIENLFVIQKHKTPHNFGGIEFLGMESLTYVPIQKKLMNVQELSSEEIDWVNSYHRVVWEKLSDKVSNAAKMWLEQNTTPL